MPPTPTRSYELVKDEIQLGEAMLACISAGTIALDTETTGLDIHGAGFKLVGIVLADRKDHAYYLPVGHEGFQGTSEPVNLDLAQVRSALEQIFEHCKIIYHNMAYDRSVLKKTLAFDWDVTTGEDTILIGQLADENMSNSLKVRAKRYLGVQEVSPKITDVTKQALKDELLDSYEYEATDKNGRPYKKTGWRVKGLWVTNLADYYLQFAKGATPYRFVTGLLGKAYQVMKENSVEGVEFTGGWQGDFRHVPPEIGVYYACDDAINTLALYYEYVNDVFLFHPELEELYKNVEWPVNDIMMRATYRGMLANREHLDQMKTTLARRKDEFLEQALEVFDEIISEADPHGNYEWTRDTLLTSTTQLQTLLYSVMDFPVKQHTKTGNPAVSKDTLKALRSEKASNDTLTELGHKFIELKLKFQDVSKLENTYTDSLSEKIDPEGRIHSSYNTVGTVSGRMSSNSPNFQQMPRLTPEEVAAKPWLYGIDVRASFTAEPGYVFVTADWTSMEMVVAAAVSNEKALKKLLAEGKDLHSHTARIAFNVGHDLDDAEFKAQYKMERQDAKIVNFSQLFSGTWWTLHKNFGFPEGKARMLEEGFKKAFPDLAVWMSETYQTLDEKGYVVYPEYGFIKRMDKPPRAMARKDPRGYQRQMEAAKRTCLNAMIQGYSAYIAKEALVKIDEELAERDIDGWVSHQIHDEIGVQVRVDQAEEAQEILLKHMRRFVDDVWLDADPEIKLSMSKAEASLDVSQLPSLDRNTVLAGLTHDAEAHEDESLDEIQTLHTFHSVRAGEYVGVGVRQL